MELNSFGMLRGFKSPDLRFGLLLLALSFFLAALSLGSFDLGKPRARSPFLAPPHVQHFTFGHREQVADSLWLRSVQDFDYCEQEVAKQTCRSTGWLFRMLDLITDLAPDFRMPYATGGLALTVLVNDFSGASRIFDKAVVRFPKDWPILSRAAYHALYEEKNKEKAARLLEQAAKAGGPSWYYMLAARLSSEEGDLAFLENLIAQLESESSPDPLLIKGLKDRLEKARQARPVDSR